MSRHFLSVLVLLVSLLPAASAAPKIDSGGIVNAASSTLSRFPNYGIAQGSMFVIYGTGLGPAQIKVSSEFPIPKSLGGTSVQVKAAGQTFDCPVIYTLDTQVAAILPSLVPVGDADITVNYNAAASNAQTVPVVAHAFGMFTRSQDGKGPVIVQNFVSQTQLPVNGLNESLKPGQVGILWGTGLGAIAGNDAAAPPVGDLKAPFTLLIAGKPAEVTYKGRSGCCSAVDQVIFKTPANLSGCYLPIVAIVDGVYSNFGSISIAPNGGSCSDEYSFTSAEMDRVGKAANARTAEVSLYRSNRSGRNVSFQRFDYGMGVFRASTPALLMARPGPDQALPPGSCTVLQERSNSTRYYQPWDTLLNGKSNITWKGPGGSVPLIQGNSGLYQVSGSTLLTNQLSPGVQQVTKDAMGDFGPLDASISAPQALTFTNRGSLSTVDRTKPLEVQWSNATDFARVIVQVASESLALGRYGEVNCSVDPAAGKFTFPPELLQLLTPSSIGVTSIEGGSVSITGYCKPSHFTGNGLEAGVLHCWITETNDAAIQ